MPATSSACRFRPIGRSGAAAKAAPACRRATRISSPSSSSPRPIRRFCSSPRSAKSTRRKSGVCRLAAPQARGKALVNILPLEQGERITTIMPLPEDEAQWEKLDVMFATTRGTVRRNKLSDFAAGQPRRQDRDEARRRRADRRRADLHRERRRAADDRATASASVSRSPTCGSSRAAIRWACAASRSPRAIGSFRSPILRHIEAEQRRTRGLSQNAPGASPARRPRRSEATAEETNGEDGCGGALAPNAMPPCRRRRRSS